MAWVGPSPDPAEPFEFNQEEGIYLLRLSPDNADAVEIFLLDYDLTEPLPATGPVLVFPSLTTVDVPESVTSAAVMSGGQIVFLDSVSGTVYVANPESGEYQVMSRQGAPGELLRSPVSIVHCCRDGAQLDNEFWIAEGDPPPGWELDDPVGIDQDGHGGIIRRSVIGGGSAEQVPRGGGSWQVPAVSSKALSLAWRGGTWHLLAVAGGNSPRFLDLQDIQSPWTAGALEWRYPPGWDLWAPADFGATQAPILPPVGVAPLRYDALVLGGELGLSVATQHGNHLGLLWSAGAESNSAEVADAARLVSIVADPLGLDVYALWVDLNGEGLVARWDSLDLPPGEPRTICVAPDGPPTGCEPAAGTCDLDCGDLQQAIDEAADQDELRLEEGIYEGNFVIHGRSLTLTAEGEDVGKVILRGIPNAFLPTLDIRGVGLPGVRLVGLVMTGGTGASIDLEASQGGGLYAWDSAVTLDRVVLMDNEAEELGGGAAFIQPRQTLLSHVGIFGNHSFGEGAGVWMSEEGRLQPSEEDESAYRQVIEWTTVAANEPTVRPDHPVPALAFGSGSYVLTDSIVVGPGDELLLADDPSDLAVARVDVWSTDESVAPPDGEGVVSVDPRFKNGTPDCMDFHLASDSPLLHLDKTGQALGMYGGSDSPEGWGPQEGWPDEGADCTEGDDDSTGDDDTAGDDDSSANPGPTLPSGLHCACDQRVAPKTGGAAVLSLLASLGIRRRRLGRRPCVDPLRPE